MTWYKGYFFKHKKKKFKSKEKALKSTYENNKQKPKVLCFHFLSKEKKRKF